MNFWYDGFALLMLCSALEDQQSSLALLEHHVTGVLIGTGSITPRATSLIKSLWTFSSQCKGIATGVWTATGLISILVGIGKGSPFISGKVCLVHRLKAEAP